MWKVKTILTFAINFIELYVNIFRKQYVINEFVYSQKKKKTTLVKIECFSINTVCEYPFN